MYLFIDCETTGLPRNYSLPASEVDNWPRVVQLAWVFADSECNTQASAGVIIRPEGFVIPPESSRIHGITHERAMQEGVDLRQTLSYISQLASGATVLVAHNTDFDSRVVGAEFIRAGSQNPLDRLQHRCTMKEATDWCRIPRNYGYKWPKLTELHNRLFSCDFDGAHDAVNDCLACMKCFFELRRQGVIA